MHPLAFPGARADSLPCRARALFSLTDSTPQQNVLRLLMQLLKQALAMGFKQTRSRRWARQGTQANPLSAAEEWGGPIVWMRVVWLM